MCYIVFVNGQSCPLLMVDDMRITKEIYSAVAEKASQWRFAVDENDPDDVIEDAEKWRDWLCEEFRELSPCQIDRLAEYAQRKAGYYV